MWAHMGEPPPRASAVAPERPAAVRRRRARARWPRSPSDRYLSAGDLGRAAHAAAEGQLSAAPSAASRPATRRPTRRTPSRARPASPRRDAHGHPGTGLARARRARRPVVRHPPPPLPPRPPPLHRGRRPALRRPPSRRAGAPPRPRDAGGVRCPSSLRRRRARARAHRRGRRSRRGRRRRRRWGGGGGGATKAPGRGVGRSPARTSLTRLNPKTGAVIATIRGVGRKLVGIGDRPGRGVGRSTRPASRRPRRPRRNRVAARDPAALEVRRPTRSRPVKEGVFVATGPSADRPHRPRHQPPQRTRGQRRAPTTSRPAWASCGARTSSTATSSASRPAAMSVTSVTRPAWARSRASCRSDPTRCGCSTPTGR